MACANVWTKAFCGSSTALWRLVDGYWIGCGLGSQPGWIGGERASHSALLTVASTLCSFMEKPTVLSFIRTLFSGRLPTMFACCVPGLMRRHTHRRLPTSIESRMRFGRLGRGRCAIIPAELRNDSLNQARRLVLLLRLSYRNWLISWPHCLTLTATPGKVW